MGNSTKLIKPGRKRAAPPRAIAPGEVRNPNGICGVRQTPEVRGLRLASRANVIQIYAGIVDTPVERLKEIRDDPDSPGLEACIASIMLRARLTGDVQALDSLMDRVIGRPLQSLQAAVFNPNDPDDVRNQNEETINAILAALLRERERRKAGG